MKPLKQFPELALVVSVLCSWGTGFARTAEADSFETNIRPSEEMSQNHFFYEQSEYPRDCEEVLRGCSSRNSSGIFVIKPEGYPELFEVRCEHSADTISWTVIQQRDDLVDFNRMWDDYKNGFGFLSSNYWLGSDKLSYLTNQAVYELRVDMELSNGSSMYISYNGFRIGDEWDDYKILRVGNFSYGGDGSMTSCPPNMVHGNCTCLGTCAEPSGSSSCPTNCDMGAVGCFCPAGFLMSRDNCVPRSECPCFWSGANVVVPNGHSHVSDDCTERHNCTNNQLVVGEYRCDSNAECAIRNGVRGCYCSEDYEGNGQSCVPRDCYAVYNAGHRQYGVYTIQPPDWPRSPFNVSCVMTNGGGWTVFQRRTGRDRGTNFYRDWASYREGFGSFDGDFWLGNEKLYYLTRRTNHKLRVDLRNSEGSAVYAEYTTFGIASEGDKYRLTASGHSGNSATDVGHGMYNSNGRGFSTYDNDNDECGIHNCAAEHRGAWWYTNTWCTANMVTPWCYRFIFGRYNTICTDSNPNGDYNGGNGETLNWNHEYNCNLNSVEMKIRPAV